MREESRVPESRRSLWSAYWGATIASAMTLLFAAVCWIGTFENDGGPYAVLALTSFAVFLGTSWLAFSRSARLCRLNPPVGYAGSDAAFAVCLASTIPFAAPLGYGYLTAMSFDDPDLKYAAIYLAATIALPTIRVARLRLDGATSRVNWPFGVIGLFAVLGASWVLVAS